MSKKGDKIMRKTLALNAQSRIACELFKRDNGKEDNIVENLLRGKK